MAQLGREPQIVKLAKDLGLDWRGDCLGTIRGYALAQIDRIIRGSPIPIASLDLLRWVVADKFRLKLEFIYTDDDIERIVNDYPDFHPLLRRRLVHEFVNSGTEGITLERDASDPRVFRYLAVVDARGDRAPRAYFTAWHEVAHLLLHPAQFPFPGFRRTPSEAQRSKDPLESLVDHVTGRVAFYPPLFRPTLERTLEERGELTFDALDVIREAAAPTASLFATAMGAVHLLNEPALFVTAELALKAEEHRFSRGAQQTFEFALVGVEEKLRVTIVAPNDLVLGSSIEIRRNMRVPDGSALVTAYKSATDITLCGDEDQKSWETSHGGPLAPLALRVQAARRGRYVYGLITTRQED